MGLSPCGGIPNEAKEHKMKKDIKRGEGNREKANESK